MLYVILALLSFGFGGLMVASYIHMALKSNWWKVTARYRRHYPRAW